MRESKVSIVRSELTVFEPDVCEHVVNILREVLEELRIESGPLPLCVHSIARDLKAYAILAIEETLPDDSFTYFLKKVAGPRGVPVLKECGPGVAWSLKRVLDNEVSTVNVRLQIASLNVMLWADNLYLPDAPSKTRSERISKSDIALFAKEVESAAGRVGEMTRRYSEFKQAQYWLQLQEIERKKARLRAAQRAGGTKGAKARQQIDKREVLRVAVTMMESDEFVKIPETLAERFNVTSRRINQILQQGHLKKKKET